MYVELELQELTEIDAALSIRYHELQVELTHTDRRQLRVELRERLQALETLAARVHGLLLERQPSAQGQAS